MVRFRQITLNVLYFLNVLLIFLLIVESKVQLPVYLQVTGRMHPLILHFPLALLFVAIFLEVLGTRKEFRHPAVYKITEYALDAFALSAAFAALFGFFLYKEGTYLGEEVTLHKWTGSAVSILAVVLLWLKNSELVAVYYGTLGLSTVGLVFAGHLGAEVTHGEGFLTEPIRKVSGSGIAQIENADSAWVFRDVIQPILNEKCVNCHNENRAKNDLILADYESIVQGGENPNTLVPGNAAKSLLYKYALLPMSDSLHMPPKEKLQLDREEIKLIGWWINTGAKENDRYVNLPKVDSIQTIMLAKFHPKSGLDLLNIPFADKDEIKKVNNPYRTVQQISATKPYVAVFLGSKKDFSSKDLKELEGINEQVVSIDMGNSTVTDADLKNLTLFQHVQKLHLQNLSIGDEGVKYLRDLNYLDVLNLSGTKISTKTLDEIAGWKNLKKLYVYNTALSPESVKALTSNHSDLEVYNTQFDLTDSVYNAQLTTPVVKIDSAFFHTKANIDVKLSRGKVRYYYTLDGTEPTSTASVYTEPFQVTATSEFKIKATMDGWEDSKVATFPLVKIGIRPRMVALETKPDAKYSGKLDSTLVDGKSGGLNHEEKAYLGYVGRSCQLLLELDKPEQVSTIAVSFLEDMKNGVFAPALVEVWGGENKDDLVKLGEVVTTVPKDKRPASKGVIKIDFPEHSVRFVRIQAKNMNAWPAGVEGKKDKRPSVFIDEVTLD